MYIGSGVVKMGVLKKRIKKYNKYIIEIENDEIEANNFENMENIVIISNDNFEDELQKSKELSAKLHSIELENKLTSLKLQERDLELQKANSKLNELEGNYQSQLNTLEKKYLIKINELDQLLNASEDAAQNIKKEYLEIEKKLGNKAEETGNLQSQIELYKASNEGLKEKLQNKETELDKLKISYNDLSNFKSSSEKEINKLKSTIDQLRKIQIEYDKLENRYRHLQEVANKKDRNIIELEAKTRSLEQYLSMSLEAITTLKNLGLFNRLFNRIPEGIDELQEDIKKLQPPREIEIDEYDETDEYEDEYEEIDEYKEIEPIRAKSTTDILGEKE